MQRYQNIQRTIATERPEEDSGSQSCEQVLAGGNGGGGGSDSEAESSQSSLGMSRAVPWFRDGIQCLWQCASPLPYLVAWCCALGEREQCQGQRSGQSRKRQGDNKVKQTEVSHQEVKQKWIHIKTAPAPCLGGLQTEDRWTWGLGAGLLWYSVHEAIFTVAYLLLVN